MVTAHSLIRPLMGTLPNRVIRKDASTNSPAPPASHRAVPRVMAASVAALSADSPMAPCMVMPFISISRAWKDSLISSGTASNVGTRLAAP